MPESNCSKRAKVQVTLELDALVYEDIFGYYVVDSIEKIDTSELLEKIECGDIECEILEFCEDVKEGD